MKKSSLKKPSDKKDVFGAFLVDNAEFSNGKHDMPVVRSNIEALPTSLFSYQRVGNKRVRHSAGTALHFYVYDYVFDGEYGIWNALIRGNEFARGFNLEKLDGFDCIIAPDYSLYLDMPIDMQSWNVYRSRVVVHSLQDLGYKVIVNVRWTDESSYEFCFEGIEEGSIVAVGSYGCSKTNADRYLFDKGLEELIQRIHPEIILFYGSVTSSMEAILEEHNQSFISYDPDMTVAMEEAYRGNEGE